MHHPPRPTVFEPAEAYDLGGFFRDAELGSE